MDVSERFFYFYFMLGAGEAESRRQEGGDWFLLKVAWGAGLPGEGRGGGRGPGGCLRGIGRGGGNFFCFSGPKFPPSSVVHTFFGVKFW